MSVRLALRSVLNGNWILKRSVCTLPSFDFTSEESEPKKNAVAKQPLPDNGQPSFGAAICVYFFLLLCDLDFYWVPRRCVQEVAIKWWTWLWRRPGKRQENYKRLWPCRGIYQETERRTVKEIGTCLKCISSQYSSWLAFESVRLDIIENPLILQITWHTPLNLENCGPFF